MLTMQGTPPAFHLLAKPTGPICNLDCEYCFFLSKEMLYPGDRFRMADDMLEEYIRQLLESHRTPEVTVAWQGGEPTMMGLDFFKRSIELVEQYPPPDAACRLHDPDQRGADRRALGGLLQGEQLPRRACRSTARATLHDTYRVDKRGGGSFDRVMAGYAHLQAAEVDVNVLCTVHAANQDRGADVYRFFRDDMGVQFIQFIPIIERTTETLLPIANLGWSTERTEKRPLYVQQGTWVTDRSVGADAYGRFLIDVFDEWVKRDVGEVYVQMFDTALANWHGEPGALCVFSETCGLALAVEHNGDLYSCDHFVEPDYLLGNITETPMIELVASDQQRKFGMDKRDYAPAVLPRLRCAIRLPRWVSAQPVHHHSGRRGRPQLPLPELQGVLQPHRPGDEAHVPSPQAEPGPVRDRATRRTQAQPLRGSGRPLDGMRVCRSAVHPTVASGAATRLRWQPSRTTVDP